MGSTPHIHDWFTLELAFTCNAPEHNAFLDLRTGRVRTFHTNERQAEQALRDFATAPGRFVRIEPIPLRDQRRWMVQFAASIRDELLRGQLDRVRREGPRPGRSAAVAGRPRPGEPGANNGARPPAAHRQRSHRKALPCGGSARRRLSASRSPAIRHRLVNAGNARVRGPTPVTQRSEQEHDAHGDQRDDEDIPGAPGTRTVTPAEGAGNGS